jgi:hypothetical protein
MTHRAFRLTMVMAAVLAVVSLTAVTPTGQVPAANRWNPARLTDGQPDMQGVWTSDAVGADHSVEDGRDPESDIIQHRAAVQTPIMIVDPADGRIPYNPEAAARRRKLLADIFTPTKPEHVDPHVRNLLDGVPRINYVPGAMQIRQIPGYMTIFYESNHVFRVIPLDGRPHVGTNVKLWMGDSRGRWEGNTLVVDVTNFNDGTWFDSHGSFHSDALHVVERWTRVSDARIDYTVTIEDPNVFTQPWKMAITIKRNKDEQDYEQWEDARHEGDHDAENILRAGRRDKEAGVTGIHEHPRAR